MDGTLMMGYGLYKDLLGGRPSTDHLSEAERIRLEALSVELNAAIRSIRTFRRNIRQYLESEEFEAQPK